MYLSIIILPLLGSIVSGFFGRKVGVTGSRILGCLISMLIPVLIISSLVHFYSIGYMSHDPHNQRFFSYLSLFTFMMIILVTAANQSSLSAFLTNRVGDAFLMIGITVFSLAPYINENITTIIGICLLIGAMAKSSQIYSLIGLFQQDIKKIIAYSTMSQLGMMVIAIGLSSYNVAIFHLINHAFYKGLLFLGAGAVIHAVVDNQDLRKYGGLISFLPLTYSVILIASLSLVAFPFMTGFYSKDFILESAYVKVIYLTFLTNPNGPVNYYRNAHESDIFISLPLVILAVFSIYFGYITRDIFIGLGSGFFIDNSIFIHPVHEIMIDTEFALAIIYSEFMPNIISNFKLSNLGYYIYGFFNQLLEIGGQTTKVLDKGSIESIGPYGFGVILTKASKIISSLSNGVVTNYALYILIGICFYLSIFTFVQVVDDVVNSITIASLVILMLYKDRSLISN
ncbi:NADH dehydrogenase subunit 5 [Fusarium oxysporum II5]|nr:NADH dehydrogenase subunit 5 [Fusarium oxysporum II5]